MFESPDPREARGSTWAWDRGPNYAWDPQDSQDSRTPSHIAIASAREWAPIFS
jgi:hypothetical protein